MTQLPLEIYRIDMKYIRNLHNIDDRIFSVSPQIGKDKRSFLGIIIICNEHRLRIDRTFNFPYIG